MTRFELGNERESNELICKIKIRGEEREQESVNKREIKVRSKAFNNWRKSFSNVVVAYRLNRKQNFNFGETIPVNRFGLFVEKREQKRCKEKEQQIAWMNVSDSSKKGRDMEKTHTHTHTQKQQNKRQKSTKKKEAQDFGNTINVVSNAESRLVNHSFMGKPSKTESRYGKAKQNDKPKIETHKHRKCSDL
ncbi:hypothetical protein SOMG_01234 [Schizosaccharomyces osmophilus]|uniref:Uncharacterized protein n=1 Tax=Schizosaccharomyces osmophilus TaxID=2545709 RepID=A0AAF0AUV0_9SCHI|nr:uncharacterized protein SOMG_01234 [Schizosaccharomyces osmophilus]WBW71269.1 hypothetical protein SOMG_01234 [Schizosaccharomyces osmophilus]